MGLSAFLSKFRRPPLDDPRRVPLVDISLRLPAGSSKAADVYPPRSSLRCQRVLLLLGSVGERAFFLGRLHRAVRHHEAGPARCGETTSKTATPSLKPDSNRGRREIS